VLHDVLGDADGAEVLGDETTAQQVGSERNDQHDGGQSWPGERETEDHGTDGHLEREELLLAPDAVEDLIPQRDELE
jgi:hypothetical protein